MVKANVEVVRVWVRLDLDRGVYQQKSGQRMLLRKRRADDLPRPDHGMVSADFHSESTFERSDGMVQCSDAVHYITAFGVDDTAFQSNTTGSPPDDVLAMRSGSAISSGGNVLCENG